MDTMLYFIARGAKHAGKCLESMVSADPKRSYISEKQTSTCLDGSINPWSVIHTIMARLKSSVVIMKITKNKDD